MGRRRKGTGDTDEWDRISILAPPGFKEEVVHKAADHFKMSVSELGRYAINHIWNNRHRHNDKILDELKAIGLNSILNSLSSINLNGFIKEPNHLRLYIDDLSFIKKDSTFTLSLFNRMKDHEKTSTIIINNKDNIFEMAESLAGQFDTSYEYWLASLESLSNDRHAVYINDRTSLPRFTLIADKVALTTPDTSGLSFVNLDYLFSWVRPSDIEPGSENYYLKNLIYAFDLVAASSTSIRSFER